MAAKIFLDDIRLPANGWIHVKTLSGIVNVLSVVGHSVEVVSMDHDLGEGKTAGIFILQLILNLRREGALPELKYIEVHSDNPVGAEIMREMARREGLYRESTASWEVPQEAGKQE